VRISVLGGCGAWPAAGEGQASGRWKLPRHMDPQISLVRQAVLVPGWPQVTLCGLPAVPGPEAPPGGLDGVIG
jgi:hypothetical protein